jgi:hypothetical protein
LKQGSRKTLYRAHSWAFDIGSRYI